MDHLRDIHSYGLNVKNREIFLHNFLGSNDEANPGVEFRMASVFLKNIKILEHISHDPITIYMNSVGGEWADGMLIYDAIQLSKCYVTTVVYAQAESMSSIILQAADERVLSPNSYFMPHYGSTDAGGEYLSVQNWVKFEKYICDVMFNIYAQKCYKGKFFKDKYGGTKETIPKVTSWLRTKLKNGDWYIDAKEAIHYGFADKILS